MGTFRLRSSGGSALRDGNTVRYPPATSLTTDWFSPTTTSTAGVPLAALTNPNNLRAQDDTYATRTGTGTVYGEAFLQDWEDPSGNTVAAVVPADATVTGVEVVVNAYVDSGAQTHRARWYDGSTAKGSGNCDVWYNPSLYSDDDSYHGVTFDGDGTPSGDYLPSTAEIRNSHDGTAGFRLLWRVQHSSGTRTHYIDHVKMRVVYTTAAEGEEKSGGGRALFGSGAVPAGTSGRTAHGRSTGGAGADSDGAAARSASGRASAGSHERSSGTAGFAGASIGRIFAGGSARSSGIPSRSGHARSATGQHARAGGLSGRAGTGRSSAGGHPRGLGAGGFVGSGVGWIISGVHAAASGTRAAANSARSTTGGAWRSAGAKAARGTAAAALGTALRSVASALRSGVGRSTAGMWARALSVADYRNWHWRFGPARSHWATGRARGRWTTGGPHQ